LISNYSAPAASTTEGGGQDLDDAGENAVVGRLEYVAASPKGLAGCDAGTEGTGDVGVRAEGKKGAGAAGIAHVVLGKQRAEGATTTDNVGARRGRKLIELDHDRAELGSATAALTDQDDLAHELLAVAPACENAETQRLFEPGFERRGHILVVVEQHAGSGGQRGRIDRLNRQTIEGGGWQEAKERAEIRGVASEYEHTFSYANIDSKLASWPKCTEPLRRQYRGKRSR